MSAPLLAVDRLHVRFSTRAGEVDAVRDVSLALEAGEILGVVGESGSGKSVTAYAAAGLLERAGRIVSGTVRYRGRDVTNASPRALRAVHAARIAMILQNPRAALNPIRTVGAQIADALAANRRLTGAETRARSLALLEDVLIREPERRLSAFPHELSGGMCQRVMIAVAIAGEPDLLIADEPTTGLDVTTQRTVMELLTGIIARRGMGMMLITHDLGLAAQYCGRVAVMERGLIREGAPAAALFAAPAHPYTRRLVAASPTATSRVEDLTVDGGDAPAEALAPAPRAVGARPILEVRGLGKRFDGFQALADVSFAMEEGASVGLVGESGSGKSTLSRLVCRLLDPSEGAIRFEGEDIGETKARDFHASPLRPAIQLVFQDPHDSLNPRFTAFDSIAHPLRRFRVPSGREGLRRRVHECARRTGLAPDLLDRLPHQLSGGQKARVGIARALACRPRLLVLDEPTAALDVSVQAVVLQLLDRLRREEGLSFLFVSHDLNVVRMMCQRIVVLREGRIVEEGVSEDLFAAPRTDYVRSLLAAIPKAPSLGARPHAISDPIRTKEAV